MARVVIQAPTKRFEAAKAFAADRLHDRQEVLLQETPDIRPLLAAGEAVFFLPWSEDLLDTDSLPEGLLDDIKASTRAADADMAVPDPAWIPDLRFTYYAPGRGGRLYTAGPIPTVGEFASCRVNHYVPAASILAKTRAWLDHHVERRRGTHMAVAEKCDMGCVMCPFYGADRDPESREHYAAYMRRREPRDLLDVEGFQSLLQGMQSLQPVDNVSIFGPGEPLRNPAFLDILRLCAEKGVGVSMATNGRHLDKAFIDALQDLSVRTIILSVDAACEATYRTIKAAGDYAALLEQARSLRTVSDAGAGFVIKASFIRQEHNADEEEAFTQVWSGIAHEAVFTAKYFLGRPGAAPQWTAPAPLPCASLGFGVHALTNGDCWTCSAGAPDTFSLGNILEDGPAAVLEAQRSLVRAHTATGRAGPLCASCQWWRQTQHCREYVHGTLARIVRPYSMAIPLEDPPAPG